MYDYKAKFSRWQGFFKKSDLDELSENYIVTKALHAFAHTGAIPKVYSCCYVSRIHRYFMTFAVPGDL